MPNAGLRRGGQVLLAALALVVLLGFRQHLMHHARADSFSSWTCGPAAQAYAVSFSGYSPAFIHSRGCDQFDQSGSGTWNVWASTTSTDVSMTSIVTQATGQDRCGPGYAWTEEMQTSTTDAGSYGTSGSAQGTSLSCPSEHDYDARTESEVTPSSQDGYQGEIVDVINPGQIPGLFQDANGNGVVDAVDALCILRSVANLPGTTACPSPLASPDANQDQQVTSVDALCVLRWVAALPGTLACPDDPSQVPPGYAPPQRPPNLPAPTGPSQVQLSLTPSTVTVPYHGSTTLTLDASAGTGAGLGAWTVDLSYDPTEVRVTGCTGASGSTCNASYASGTARITGTSSSGLMGVVSLGSVSVEAVGPKHSQTTVSLAVPTLANPLGTALSSTTAGCTITIHGNG